MPCSFCVLCTWSGFTRLFLLWSALCRYQMVIMFLLGAASTAAAVSSTSAAVAHVVDGCHRLRPERLLPRPKSAGVNGLLTEGAKQVSFFCSPDACAQVYPITVTEVCHLSCKHYAASCLNCQCRHTWVCDVRVTPLRDQPGILWCKHLARYLLLRACNMAALKLGLSFDLYHGLSACSLLRPCCRSGAWCWLLAAG
jgi:hypothetical protein